MIQDKDNNGNGLSPEKYGEACEEQGKRIEAEVKGPLSIEDAIVEEFNRRLAVIHTRSTYIIFEKSPTEFVLDSKGSMKIFFATDMVEIEGKKRLKIDLWLESPKRRRYEDIVFDPTRVGHYDGKYNLWKGFAYKPVMGECILFLAHMRDNICSGNEKHYQYLFKWCAHLIQRPWVIGSAIVMRGAQGVGKGVFVHGIGKLFGVHYAPLASLDQILGRFNSHLQNAVLIFADEAVWGGNRKELGALKAMITERRQFIEAKGKDGFWINNFKHLIVSSNEDFAVHLDADDRRFFVLNVSSQRKEDNVYFKAIEQELENGGYAALMEEFMNCDLTGFDPRNMPDNFAGFDMKLMSAPSVDRYVYSSLKCGYWDEAIATPSGEFKEEIVIGTLYKLYAYWCDWENDKAVRKEEMGSRLKKLFPTLENKRTSRQIDVKRPEYYRFPSLEVCRIEFEKAYKQNASIWGAS